MNQNFEKFIMAVIIVLLPLPVIYVMGDTPGTIIFGITFFLFVLMKRKSFDFKNNIFLKLVTYAAMLGVVGPLVVSELYPSESTALFAAIIAFYSAVGLACIAVVILLQKFFEKIVYSDDTSNSK
jgi:hypothetical protein